MGLAIIDKETPLWSRGGIWLSDMTLRRREKHDYIFSGFFFQIRYTRYVRTRCCWKLIEVHFFFELLIILAFNSILVGLCLHISLLLYAYAEIQCDLVEVS